MKKQDPVVKNLEKLLGVVQDLTEAMKVQQNMITLMAEHLNKTSEGLVTVLKITQSKLMQDKKKKKK